MKMSLFTSRYAIIASMVVFALSLTQKAYCTTSVCSDSIILLVMGWASIFYGAVFFCWLANPLLFISWVMVKRKPKLTLFTSSASFLFAFFFLLVDRVVVNENNGSEFIVARKAGYWLWLASHCIMLAVTYREMLIFNRKKREQAMQQRTYKF